MNTKNKVVIAFTAIVLGLIVSPAIAASETVAMKTAVESFENSSKSNTVKTVMIIGHEEPQFVPQIIHLKVNDSIRFINQDGQEGGLAHDVVSIDKNTGVPDGNFGEFLQNVGDIYTVKFSESGTYYYIDTIHPHMRGTIVVS